MKKILIVSNEFPPKLGGAGGVALNLANDFSDLNYDVSVLTTSRSKNKDSNFKIIYIKKIYKFYFLSYLIYFFKNKLEKYDLIILNDLWGLYSASLIFDKNELKKSVIYIHGIEKYLYKTSIYNKILKIDKILNRSFNQVKGIICVSNFIKEKFFNINLTEHKEKASVIYNGVNLDEMKYVESNLKKELNIKEEQVVLLSVSRFTQKKGYDIKLEILKKLIENKKNVIWLIAGDGDYKKEFEYKIKKEKLESKIILLGAVERRKLAKYYSIADIFWLLSEYEEAFPLVYYEAKACGAYPIGWNKSGVKEVIIKGHGFLADSAQEVIDKILEFNYFYHRNNKKEKSKDGILSSKELARRIEKEFIEDKIWNF